MESNVEELTRCQKFRVLCARESIIISSLVLGIGGSQFFVFYLYGGRFEREGVWVFFTLGVVSCLLALSFLVRTFMNVCSKEKKDDVNETEKKEKKEVRIIAVWKAVKVCYFALFDVNGKYYLSKMYFSEVFEHTVQVSVMTTTYLCLMPLHITIIVSAILTVELLINIWATFHMNSQEIRDRLLFLDVVIEIFCLGFPLLYIWFSYRIPVPLGDLLLMMVYPTLSLLSKLNDIWEDYFKMDLQRIDKKRMKAKKRSSRRSSILNLSINKTALETQLKYFPGWLRYSFTGLNVAFALFFSGLICVQLATQPSAKECSAIYTKEVWDGCVVPVPFCQNLFIARCDCAVLQMTHYSRKTFPESFGNLSSLVKLGVYTGQLETLPDTFGKNHKKLLVLHLISNQLTSLPESIGKLKNLIYLWVFNNQLTSLPESVGKLKNLNRLNIFNNQLTSLSESVGELKNLLYLPVHNNQLTSLPESIGKLNNLIYLNVFNNQLNSLPESIGELKKLQALYAWNNTLNSMPENVGGMKSLIWVDFRHNNLVTLPSAVNKWSKIEYFYVAGNPLCPNFDFSSNLKTAKGLCERQCSADCPGHQLGHYGCDDNDYTYEWTNPKVKPKLNSGCNTAECEYDKGDCPN